MTRGTTAAGTTMTARSTGSGMAAMEGNAFTPATLSASGFTGKTTPPNPPLTMLRKRTLPIDPAFRLAPTTATDRGARTRATEAASAVRSRAVIESIEESSNPNSMSQTP